MTHFKTLDTLDTLDTVALLIDLADYGLVKGQVGTIVEMLDENVFEVEFSDKNGRTLSTVAIDEKDLMLLYFETVKSR